MPPRATRSTAGALTPTSGTPHSHPRKPRAAPAAPPASKCTRSQVKSFVNDGELRRLRRRRLDQHIDAAGGDGELAPGLVIDRHAVLDALGAGQALGVA